MPVVFEIVVAEEPTDAKSDLCLTPVDSFLIILGELQVRVEVGAAFHATLHHNGAALFGWLANWWLPAGFGRRNGEDLNRGTSAQCVEHSGQKM